MLKPVGDRVFIRKHIETEEGKSSGGIILPKASEIAKVAKGVVETVGSDVTLVKPKDEVIVGIFAGTELEEDGDVYVLVREGDILAVIN